MYTCVVDTVRSLSLKEVSAILSSGVRSDGQVPCRKVQILRHTTERLDFAGPEPTADELANLFRDPSPRLHLRWSRLYVAQISNNLVVQPADESGWIDDTSVWRHTVVLVTHILS